MRMLHWNCPRRGDWRRSNNRLNGLPHRNPERNSLGMLRKAIESDWSKPDSIISTEKKQQRIQQNQIEATQAEKEGAQGVESQAR